MIKPIFQSAQSRAFGFRTNYLTTLTGEYLVRTDTVKGVVWEILTPKDFTERYVV